MRLVVTGSNGSVGRRVVIAALRAGHTVIGIDNAPSSSDELGLLSNPLFSFCRIDLTDYEAALEALRGAEAVIQLAAIRTPEDYAVKCHNTNVVISWNVLRAAAELGITRIAQASSVNVITLVWSQQPKLYYLPLDEEHPCEPDEPYGLSKLICELQANTIVRRYPKTRIASLRLSWSIPNRAYATHLNPERRKNDLWGWIQEDAGAEAFLRAVDLDDNRWAGHEAFFIAAANTTQGDPMELYHAHWEDVPIKEGKNLDKGFFDCAKAERLLGWVDKVHE
ncbi:hypothetical protein NM688_g7339 [Phlebia brevispora]|uniref:Uncharacterized protein n=1 Tax=Phlebia brevispora TaxID=194682 RepID=A0ACC1S6C0_9APHY|nr:hypothetical protein NM688_g7339 [Phlebia brevispora]